MRPAAALGRNVHRARRYLVPLTAIVAILLASSALETASPTVKKCPKNRATVVVNGARSCVPASRLRQRAVTTTVTSGLLDSALTGPTTPPRLKNGRRARPVIPPALTRSLLRAYPGAETRLIEAGRQSLTRSQTARTPATQKAVSVSVSAPTVTVVNGAAKVTGSITASEGGASVTLEVGGTVKGDGGFDFDIGFSGTAANGSRASAGVTMRDRRDTVAPTCPTATGEIRAKSRYDVTKRGSETFAAGGVTLGTVREATTITASSDATGRMSPEARLLPFRFTVSADLDYSKSFQGLAFLQSRQRAVGRGTLTGVMDPVSGDVSGATRSTTVGASGFDGGDQAAEATVRRQLEKSLSDQAGRLREELRRVEARARAGDCTRIVFTPGPGADLNPNDTKTVSARLETVLNTTAVPQVSWQAFAQKGRVSPADSKAPQPAFQVTAASSGPDTANITVEATSPAGISKPTWTAKEGLPQKIQIEAIGTFTASTAEASGDATILLVVQAVKVPNEAAWSAGVEQVWRQAGNPPTATAGGSCGGPITPTGLVFVPDTAGPSTAFDATRSGDTYTVQFAPSVLLGYTGGCSNGLPITAAAAPGVSLNHPAKSDLPTDHTRGPVTQPGGVAASYSIRLWVKECPDGVCPTPIS